MKSLETTKAATGIGIGRRLIVGCAIFLVILAIAFAFDVSYGVAKVPVGSVARVLASHLPFVGSDVAKDVPDLAKMLVWNDRVPRATLALLVGTLLAMAGTALQGLLLNPLADPYTVGVSSGAALGAGIAISIGMGGLLDGFGVPLMAFLFAMAAMALVYYIARAAGRVSIHSFLLAGIVVGSFLWALLSFVIAFAPADETSTQGKIIFWLLGSFDSPSPDPWAMVRIAAPFALFGLAALFAFARDLNVFAMGEEAARHLGIETENLKLVIIAVASLVTSAAVAVSGIIGFVGLVVPHMCRKVLGSDHRVLIPTSALAGAVLTVLADLASRAVLPPSGLPVGIVTALIGAPFFLYLLKTSRTN